MATIVSSSANGVLANSTVTPWAISGNGRYVVFESAATNLVTGDTNNIQDVFLKDTQTGAITLLSATAAGVQATGVVFGNFAGDISENGRYVTVDSDGTNLVAHDTNGLLDVFISDTVSGTVTRVSTDASGNEATGGWMGSNTFDISADGRYVVFGSDATNLVAGDTNNTWDLFLKDTQTGAITRVNTAADGTQAGYTVGSENYLGGYVSDDGRYVAFNSDAGNLVAGDTNGATDIFLKDTVTGAITLVNTNAAGAQATGGGADSFTTWTLVNEIAGVSADARYVAFNSLATNLVAGDTNGVVDVFVKDTLTGAITRVSTGASGAEANGLSRAAWHNLSADGRYVVFHSTASNLVAGDTNGMQDIFVKDIQTGAIARINLDAAGGEAVGGPSEKGRISADGSTIVFRTNATNLVDGHVAGVRDVVSVANPLFVPVADTAASPVTGGAGNDILAGSAGNDSIDGGAGIDSASYAGNRANFTVTRTSTGFTVTDNTGPLGTDTLANIERLVFTDTKVALDVADGNAGTAAKILGVTVGAAHATDPAYMGVLLGYLDGGMSYADLMGAVLNFMGATTPTAAVTTLLTNVIGAPPPNEMVATCVSMIESGAYSIGALGVIAADYNAAYTANINLVGLAQTGIEFI